MLNLGQYVNYKTKNGLEPSKKEKTKYYFDMFGQIIEIRFLDLHLQFLEIDNKIEKIFSYPFQQDIQITNLID